MKSLPDAQPGEDGYVADDDVDSDTTGSIPAQTEEKSAKSSKSGGWFSGWFGSSSKQKPRAARAEDRLSKSY